MPKPNWDLIRSKVADIRHNVDVLRRYAQRPDDEFLQDEEAIRSARYALIVAVEAAANICSHLCARMLATVPESYADCFEKLGEAGIVSRDLARRLAAMARFRNLLVHGYGEVDDGRMLRMLREDLADLDEYVAALRRLWPPDKD